MEGLSLGGTGRDAERLLCCTGVGERPGAEPSTGENLLGSRFRALSKGNEHFPQLHKPSSGDSLPCPSEQVCVQPAAAVCSQGAVLGAEHTFS